MPDIKLHASGLHPASFAAQMLDFMMEAQLGFQAMAAAADVLSADCGFNYWVATDVKKRGLSEEQFLRLLDKCEIAENRGKEAIAAFKARGSQEALCRELCEVAVLFNDRSV